ncbi:MAG TPA: MBL fold metallo-hydrolase [Ohtaekwangia sp.]|nr:MBL fold metallo-hydrolase [Ohtaekwangia sp.]
MDVKVKFLGGAESVTGSRYLITIGDFRFLFDCGLFQGLKELRLRNRDDFPVDVATIDAIVISHAHIDHSGYLPKLVKEGYKGPVYCTPPTAELMELLLLDSAKLQEEEAEYARKKGYSKHENPQALYSEEDARLTFPLFKTVKLDQEFSIHDRVKVVFREAGHLLGSAITEIEIRGDRETKKIVFSGDLGRYNQQMMKDPYAVTDADVLFIESTYGDTDNPAVNPEADLARIVNAAFERDGVLVIPAFAVGRTQSLLYHLRKLMQEDVIPDVPVYVDSPMAISATYLFYKYPAYHRLPVTTKDLAADIETNMLVFVKSGEHSKTLNDIRRRAIIISASGMMTGGRILHHMFHRLRNPQDTILISGYQAEGTRGRKLLEGEPTMRIYGEDVPVKCTVELMTSLSGHADRPELFRWMGNFRDKPKFTFCVHGEGEKLKRYAQAIRDKFGWNVIVPKYFESFELFSGI